MNILEQLADRIKNERIFTYNIAFAISEEIEANDKLKQIIETLEVGSTATMEIIIDNFDDELVVYVNDLADEMLGNLEETEGLPVDLSTIVCHIDLERFEDHYLIGIDSSFEKAGSGQSYNYILKIGNGLYWDEDLAESEVYDEYDLESIIDTASLDYDDAVAAILERYDGGYLTIEDLFEENDCVMLSEIIGIIAKFKTVEWPRDAFSNKFTFNIQA